MSQTSMAPPFRKQAQIRPGLNAARIFWKEWRAQRAFWLGLFGLAIGLEFLLFVVSPWMPTNALDQLRIHRGLVMVLACSFAAGSAAIAFAGEVESKTKGLLQRIPVRARDLVLGKLAWSLIGSYVLLVGSWLSGLVALQFAGAAPLSQVDSPDFDDQTSLFWRHLLMPMFFMVIGGLFSLVLGDVLLTVLIAAVTTVALLTAPMIREHLALQGTVLAVVGLCDWFLARLWLRDGGAVDWLPLSRITLPKVSLRPRWRAAEQVAPIEARRSEVAWRRAAGSLIWKEFRQAFPFCLVLLVAGVIALLIVPLAEVFDSIRGGGIFSLILIVAAPLLPGVAAMRAERRDGAFRLLANRGVSPDGFLIGKHLVWLSLSLSVFALLLWLDWSFLSENRPSHRSQNGSLLDFAVLTANTTFESAQTSVVAPLQVAAFHVVLLYSLGFLLGLLLPGPITAFFSGIMLWLASAFCWVVVAALRIPFWWTLGFFPIIFLAVAWVRTADWLIGRNTLAARVKPAAVLLVPLAGILAATAVYRVTEIPAIAVPRAVLEATPVRRAIPAASGKRSLFLDATDALRGGPDSVLALAGNGRTVLSDGWQLATPADRNWVTQNERARRLAVEAAQHAPADFPSVAGAASDERARKIDEMRQYSDSLGMWWLAQLLLYSARKLEFEDRLDDALACYVAVARLGADAERSGWAAVTMFGPRSDSQYAIIALNWMQRWAQHPRQSTERVKKAIREFEPMPPDAASLSADILREWQLQRRRLRHPSPHTMDKADSATQWTYRFFPWERLRLDRLVDAIFAAELEEFQTVASDLRNQGFVIMTAERVASWDRNTAVPWKYLQTTLATPDLVQLPYWGPNLYVDQIADERMDLIALAIADFKHEHHKRPESLRALVPTYTQRLPVDPWTGGEFLYEPQGLPTEVDFKSGKLPPGTPFLASAGMLDSRIIRQPAAPNGKPTYDVINRFMPPKDFRWGTAFIFTGPIIRLP